MLFKKKKKNSLVLMRRMPKNKTFRARKKHGAPVPLALSSKKKWIFAGYWILCALFFAGVLYILFFSQYTKINFVRIEGEYAVSRESMLETISLYLSERHFVFFSKSNYFFFSAEELSNALKDRFRSVRSAHIEKRFPNSASASFEEHEAMLAWCSGGPCFFVSEDGRVYDGVDFERENNAYSDLIRVIDENAAPVTLGENVMSLHDVVFFTDLKKTVFEISGVDALSEYRKSVRFAREVSVDTREGWKIFINMDDDISMTARALRSFLDDSVGANIRSQLAYVDVRAEDKIFYALKNTPDISIEGDDKASPDASDPSIKESEKLKKK